MINFECCVPVCFIWKYIKINHLYCKNMPDSDIESYENLRVTGKELNLAEYFMKENIPQPKVPGANYYISLSNFC